MRKILELRLFSTNGNQHFSTDRSTFAAELSNGVHLCNFVNHLRPRSVPVVLTPLNPQVPLTTAKAKRNIENFVSACRRNCIPETFPLGEKAMAAILFLAFIFFIPVAYLCHI
jgi:hypothetical protein